MIQVKHLSKRYGDYLAVDDVSFTLEEGRIYGFLGPNGAGKSTTMNMMTGCLAASGGTVTVDGLDIFEQAREAKKLLGYLPELPPLYLEETPEEYLRFVAEAKGVPAGERQAEVERVMEETDLTHMAGRLIRNLSKGYRQRVGIAQALVGDPRYIILDEPTVGLDPLQIIEIRDLIRQLGRTRTVILSSHILSEVQALCESVLILSGGRLKAFDTPENLERQMAAAGHLVLRCEANPEELEEILATLEGLGESHIESDGTGTRAELELGQRGGDETSRELFFALAQRGRALLELRSIKADLEDIFIELTEADGLQEETEEWEEEESDESDLEA